MIQNEVLYLLNFQVFANKDIESEKIINSLWLII